MLADTRWTDVVQNKTVEVVFGILPIANVNWNGEDSDLGVIANALKVPQRIRSRILSRVLGKNGPVNKEGIGLICEIEN